MATLRYDPFRKWGWMPWGPPGRSAQRASIEHYQAPNELVLSVTRRHPVVLASTVVACSCVVLVGLATGIGVAVIPPSAVFLAWRTWRWRVACYVLTDQRLLFVDGIVYTRVRALPLRTVLDASYRRSIAGRLLGYGTIALTIDGQQGVRALRTVSRPDALYLSIHHLIAVRDITETP
ncbi:MAG TPA: PH domain-containing protein [Actinomycetota bacterium]|jgi:hypothetical protein